MLTLLTLCGEYEWLPWLFVHTPSGYWKDEANVCAFIEWLSEKLEIKEMADWYSVTSGYLSQFGGVLITTNNLYSILARVYPGEC